MSLTAAITTTAPISSRTPTPGFPREEQRLLARLVGAHRRKLALEGVEELVPPWDRSALYLIVLFRLAVLLHRGRSPTALPAIELTATPRSLEVNFPPRWLQEHPLTSADLQQEVDYRRASGFRLRVFSHPRATEERKRAPLSAAKA